MYVITREREQNKRSEEAKTEFGNDSRLQSVTMAGGRRRVETCAMRDDKPRPVLSVDNSLRVCYHEKV